MSNYSGKLDEKMKASVPGLNLQLSSEMEHLNMKQNVE